MDIAVLNGHLTGIEIKAEADNLDRLERQIISYGQVVQKAVLIVAQNHLEKSVEKLPEWWGVISVQTGPRGGITFKKQRQPKRNVDTDSIAIARLLWRGEAQEIMAECGTETKLRNRPRADLYEWLVANLSEENLIQIVLQKLKARVNWRCPEQL